MLTLTRQNGERIRIIVPPGGGGYDIVIEVVRIGSYLGKKVRLGVIAPADVRIEREDHRNLPPEVPEKKAS